MPATPKAHVESESDGASQRVAITLIREDEDGEHEYVVNRGSPTVVVVLPEHRSRAFRDFALRIREDDARALYEALADYYGHDS